MLRPIQLVVLAGLASTLAVPNSSDVSNLARRDTFSQKFTFAGCEPAQENVIKTSYSHFREMLNVQRDSLSDIQDYLIGVLNKQKTELTSKLKSNMNTFMMFFGEFDYSDQCEITDNIDRTEQLVDVIRRIDKIISDFAFSGTYAPVIFCTDKYFEYARSEDGEQIYKNTLDRDQRETANPFGEESGICDDPAIGAAMLYPTTGEVADWMLFCPKLFEKWLPTDSDSGEQSNSGPGSDLRYLTDYRALSLDAMIGKKIDHIAWVVPEVIMLHELTHSGMIFNLFDVDNHGNRQEELMMLDDVQYAPGQAAYHFDGVIALAKVSRDDPVKMVRNADTIVYHATAHPLGDIS
ncbi:hypothetical protein N7492_007329 [Penicillium capsulatum]|uniref:Lysine-specific metallo-endopeptidase domain-containing protein n=1 Tax=Penicillium capsulatum TaxID=69766 RepID=A0A9W9I2C2_9EURO|nr:hypothetical protein N7492_007329 [Penicillium capsulatum]KAJ6117169.1 hypothetical protein N7512_006894 [Penicillium capsulatum]